MKLSRDAIWHTTKAQKRERDVTRTNNLAQHKQVRERDEIGREKKKFKNETLKIHKAQLEGGFLVELLRLRFNAHEWVQNRIHKDFKDLDQM